MNIIQERYELAKTRILELPKEIEGEYGKYILQITELFQTVFYVYQTENPDKKQYETWNQVLYQDLAGEHYQTSFANPAYAVSCFGEKTGQYLAWLLAAVRDSIVAAYEKDQYEIVLRMELFLQAVAILQEEETEKFLKEMIYYYIHDYVLY